MRHINYLATIALSSLMFASCSNDELVSSPETPVSAIEFKAMANKAARAAVSTANIDRFRVWGCNMDAGTSDNHVMSFNSIYVEKSENGAWSYNNTQYWAPGKDYYFIALTTNTTLRAWSFAVPDEHISTLTPANFKGYGTVTMEITKEIEGADDAAADQDLVYAYATRTTDADITDASAIDFTFNHMLSRVALTFKNTFTNTNYALQISDIKLGGLINKATCELGTAPADLVWTPVAGDKVTVDVIVPEDNKATSATTVTTTGDYKFIIPGDGQQLNISFNVTILLDGQVYSIRTLNGTIPATDYAPGKSYMLTAEISQDNIIEGGAKPIEFNVSSVQGWGSNTDGNIQLDNDNN